MTNKNLEKSKKNMSIIISMLKTSEGILVRRNLIMHLQKELDTLAIEANRDGYEDSLYYDEDEEYKNRSVQKRIYVGIDIK